MKKQIVDCALPIDHPDHTRIVDIEEDEEVKLIEAFKNQKQVHRMPTLEERISALESKV